MSSLLMETLVPLSVVINHLKRRDVDGVDRLNYKLSSILFVTLGMVVVTTQVVGEVIKCWTPAQFPMTWTEYANSVCWISDTYYIPMSDLNILDAPRKQVVYYQWVPIALFAQALLFYVPSLMWSAANRTFGCDMHKVVETFTETDNLDPSKRDKAVSYVVKHIDRVLTYKRSDSRRGCLAAVKRRLASAGCICGKRYGNTIVILYLLVKLIYIANVTLQLYALNYFLGTDYTAYGYEALRDLVLNGASKESTRFPRVTLCDFEIRNLGRNQPYTVQCALPLNIFNEKLYIVVWFWLVLVGLANVVNFVSWTSTLFHKSRREFITNSLKAFDKYDKGTDVKLMRAFCDRYLRQDGHFMLRMMSKNTSYYVIGELITELWKNHSQKYPVEAKGAYV